MVSVEILYYFINGATICLVHIVYQLFYLLSRSCTLVQSVRVLFGSRSSWQLLASLEMWIRYLVLELVGRLRYLVITSDCVVQLIIYRELTHNGVDTYSARAFSVGRRISFMYFIYNCLHKEIKPCMFTVLIADHPRSRNMVRTFIIRSTDKF